jgi:hypothetical protein
VAQGHEVTLFASGDSRTSAELVRCSKRALRLNPEVRDHVPYHIIMLDEVRRRADKFDVLHFHIEQWHFPLIREIADRTVTTLHGRLNLPDLKPFYAAFPDIPLVSISNRQRRPLQRHINWVGNVPHGLRTMLPVQSWARAAISAFLGRISPEGRVARSASLSGWNAIEDCQIDKVDQAY